MPMSFAHDMGVVSRTLYGEARGQPIEGILAVASCIANRVYMDLGDDGLPDWWGEGWAGVCLAPWQFSCWNASDPNKKIIEKVKKGEREFDLCRFVAEQTIRGHVHDLTGGATHYYAPKVVAAPNWTQPHPKSGKIAVLTVQIGDHRFYRDVP
jgi:hypothetical protein